MKNIRALVASLLLLFSSVLYAQVRESVVLVQPNPGEDRTASFRNIAEFFRKRNLGDLADYFDAMSKNTGFGSGFLTRDPHGRLIAVTNRHVTVFSTAAKVSVTREDGTERTFPECPVIYEDPDMDIAVLLLPDDVEVAARVLRLADSVPADGEEVWTAGYPGLFGNPSWQLAKGVVSNRRVSVEALGPPEYAVFTQHSAPIDPGNSGGPLLTGDPRNPESLRVVGVNTWMVQGRQNANFAVHLDKLREALDRIPDPGKPIDPEPGVREKIERIVEGINSNAWNRSDSGRYISTRLAMRQGWGSFLALSASGAEAEAWVARFLSSPEETMREAVYHRIYQAIRGKKQTVSLASVEEQTDSEGVRFVRTALSAGSDTYYLDWYEEAGNWRIRSGDVDVRAEGLDGKDNPPSGTVLKDRSAGNQFPSGWQMGAGPRIAWKFTSAFAEIGYHRGLGRVASIGVSLLAESVLVSDPDTWWSKSEEILLSAGLLARLGFRIGRGDISVFPYIEVGGSLGVILTGEYSGTAGPTIPVGFGLAVTVSPNLSIGASADLQFTENLWESVYPEAGIHIKLYAMLRHL